MKAVILAGGLGTRMGSVTENIPKPMVEVGGKPLIHHLILHYAQHGVTEIIIAGGYKVEVIKKYFKDFAVMNSDFSVNLKSGEVAPIYGSFLDIDIAIVDTGPDTMTGGRLLRLKHLLADEPFFMTYGDGLSDVNLSKLLKFHLEHGKLATVTAVRPPARFGELVIDSNEVKSFIEKPQLGSSWINGGFFVLNTGIFDEIASDDTMFEREPLSSLAKSGQLFAYQHEGFWKCMDTPRDKFYLDDLFKTGAQPWVEG